MALLMIKGVIENGAALSQKGLLSAGIGQRPLVAIQLVSSALVCGMVDAIFYCTTKRFSIIENTLPMTLSQEEIEQSRKEFEKEVSQEFLSPNFETVEIFADGSNDIKVYKDKRLNNMFWAWIRRQETFQTLISVKLAVVTMNG